MKKLALAALSLAGATQSTTLQEQIENDTTYRFDRLDAIPYFPNYENTPPKMYGQWLQRTGRQKWNKKK